MSWLNYRTHWRMWDGTGLDADEGSIGTAEAYYSDKSDGSAVFPFQIEEEEEYPDPPAVGLLHPC